MAIEKTIEIPASVLKAGNISYDSTESGLNVDNAQDAIDKAANIAKGRNQAHVFSTTEAMQAFLSNAENAGKYNVGDNLYIVEVDVPDWWISEVLTEADAETGYYYKIAQLETQKVDLTEIEADIAAINSNLNKYVDSKKQITSDINTLKSYVLSNDCPVGLSVYPLVYGGATVCVILKHSANNVLILCISAYGNTMNVYAYNGSWASYSYNGTLS